MRLSHWLGREGFNRISIGVQGLRCRGAARVNRIQSEEETAGCHRCCTCQRFQVVSIDLIYGLQSRRSKVFGVTLDKVIAADPDRLSIYNYAHMPTLFKRSGVSMRRICLHLR